MLLRRCNMHHRPAHTAKVVRRKGHDRIGMGVATRFWRASRSVRLVHATGLQMPAAVALKAQRGQPAGRVRAGVDANTVRARLDRLGDRVAVHHHLLQPAAVVEERVARRQPERGGLPVLGAMDLIPILKHRSITALYAPIGANRVRVRLHEVARASGLVTPNFLHPAAVVGSDIEADSGVYVLAGSVVMPLSRLKRDVMLSASVNVAHHSILGQGVFLSTGASVGANIEIGACAYLGMASTVVTGKARRIGSDAIIGAGSVVLSDVADGAVVAGTPARPLAKMSRDA